MASGFTPTYGLPYPLSTDGVDIAGDMSDLSVAVEGVLLTKASLSLPILNVTPTAPTAAVDTNTTQVATTAFIINQASSVNPSSLGTVNAGSSLRYARADHVHPTTGLGLTSATLAQFSSTTSSQLAGIISDKTGSGSLVFATSPTLVTPNIGAANGTSLSISGNISVSTGNATGGGIILADDGDMVDMNNGYLSLRFSGGTQIYSGNRTGSPVITLSNSGSITATNKINGAASTTSFASLNIPHGTAPTSPNDGDMWTTSVGIYARISGYTRPIISDNSNNTAFGQFSLRYNVAGLNTAFGYGTLSSNTSGTSNSAFGNSALGNNINGNQNCAIAQGALLFNSSGSYNTAVGNQCLQNNTSGDSNTSVGWYSLIANTTGFNNTAIGYRAGFADSPNGNETGSNNTFIGNNAVGVSSTASNTITLGNSSITSLRCQVTSITSLSDLRDKKNIKSMNVGLDFINKLRPVTFDWNMRDGGKTDVSDMGFIAQEIMTIEDEYNSHKWMQLTSRINPEILETSPGRLIPILVKAIQDLSKEIESLKEKI